MRGALRKALPVSVSLLWCLKKEGYPGESRNNEESDGLRVGCAQRICESFQLVPVYAGDTFEQGPRLRGQVNFDTPAIREVALFGNQAISFTTFDQGDRTLMTCIEPRRQFADGRPVASWKTAQMQQQQILKRLQAGVVRGAFAEAQKLRQPRTESGKRDILDLGNHAGRYPPGRQIYNEVIYFGKDRRARRRHTAMHGSWLRRPSAAGTPCAGNIMCQPFGASLTIGVGETPRRQISGKG